MPQPEPRTDAPVKSDTTAKFDTSVKFDTRGLFERLRIKLHEIAPWTPASPATSEPGSDLPGGDFIARLAWAL